MTYSPEFLAAWDKFPHFRTRSGKAASYRVWQRLVLDKSPHVLAWIEQDDSLDGGQYTPGMQVWLNKQDFTEPPALDKAQPSPQDAPGRDETDWAYLITSSKKEALRAKRFHPRNPYLYPETIILAAKDIARGIKEGPPSVERVLELAQERADLVRAEVRRASRT